MITEIHTGDEQFSLNQYIQEHLTDILGQFGTISQSSSFVLEIANFCQNSIDENRSGDQGIGDILADILHERLQNTLLYIKRIKNAYQMGSKEYQKSLSISLQQTAVIYTFVELFWHVALKRQFEIALGCTFPMDPLPKNSLLTENAFVKFHSMSTKFLDHNRCWNGINLMIEVMDDDIIGAYVVDRNIGRIVGILLALGYRPDSIDSNKKRFANRLLELALGMYGPSVVRKLRENSINVPVWLRDASLTVVTNCLMSKNGLLNVVAAFTKDMDESMQESDRRMAETMIARLVTAVPKSMEAVNFWGVLLSEFVELLPMLIETSTGKTLETHEKINKDRQKHQATMFLDIVLMCLGFITNANLALGIDEFFKKCLDGILSIELVNTRDMTSNRTDSNCRSLTKSVTILHSILTVLSPHNSILAAIHKLEIVPRILHLRDMLLQVTDISSTHLKRYVDDILISIHSHMTDEMLLEGIDRYLFTFTTSNLRKSIEGIYVIRNVDTGLLGIRPESTSSSFTVTDVLKGIHDRTEEPMNETIKISEVESIDSDDELEGDRAKMYTDDDEDLSELVKGLKEIALSNAKPDSENSLKMFMMQQISLTNDKMTCYCNFYLNHFNSYPVSTILSKVFFHYLSSYLLFDEDQNDPLVKYAYAMVVASVVALAPLNKVISDGEKLLSVLKTFLEGYSQQLTSEQFSQLHNTQLQPSLSKDCTQTDQQSSKKRPLIQVVDENEPRLKEVKSVNRQSLHKTDIANENNDDEDEKIQMLGMVLSILSGIVQGTDYELSPSEVKLLQDMMFPLTSLEAILSGDNKSICILIQEVVRSIQQLSLKRVSVDNIYTKNVIGDSVDWTDWLSSLKREYLTNKEPPLRVFGLHQIVEVLKAKEKSTHSAAIEVAMSFVLPMLSDPDSYVYLQTIQVMRNMADINRNIVFDALLEVYESCIEMLRSRKRIGSIPLSRFPMIAETLALLMKRGGAAAAQRASRVISICVLIVRQRYSSSETEAVDSHFNLSSMRAVLEINQEPQLSQSHTAKSMENNNITASATRAADLAELVLIRQSAVVLLAEAVVAQGVAATRIIDVLDIASSILTMEEDFGQSSRATRRAAAYLLHMVIQGTEDKKIFINDKSNVMRACAIAVQKGITDSDVVVAHHCIAAFNALDEGLMKILTPEDSSTSPFKGIVKQKSNIIEKLM